MRIARVAWTPVRVPFATPFATARGELAAREGVLLTLTTDSGLSGWGEASPWPLFAQGDAGDAARLLADLAPRLPGRAIDEAFTLLDRLDLGMPGAPAARYALDLALHDLLGQARGVPVAVLLGGVLNTVPVNVALGAGPPAMTAARAATAVAQGFRCVKLKVGSATLDADEARVAAVRDAIGPATRLRLDANGAWSPADAIATLRRLERYDLELVEQPVPEDDLAGLAQVRRAVTTPIAADEAVRDLASAQRLVELEAADLLVVKPMVVGGLGPGRAILDLAASARLGVVVTTTIDFGIGIAGALHLAACVPPAPQCWGDRTPVAKSCLGDSPQAGRAPLACGLATAGLLATDLTGGQPAIRHGIVTVPARPGLGVEIEQRVVARYASGPTTTIPT